MFTSRLAIGTANWGKEYNGAKVSEDDQKEILDYCQCMGIDTIDWSTIYKWNDITKVSSYFHKMVKYHFEGNWALSRNALVEHLMPECLMAHGAEFFRWVWDVGRKEAGDYITRYGASIYEPAEMKKLPMHQIDVLQVPYSVFDRRFEQHFPSLKQKGVEIQR
ncbi:MAG: aldo-keto reductase family protein [Planctomycetota bacterium]|jgi:aryl-alcohol dehydrogenase-like predicted oxidoreductase